MLLWLGWSCTCIFGHICLDWLQFAVRCPSSTVCRALAPPRALLLCWSWPSTKPQQAGSAVGQLTHGEGVHPAAAVGCQLHGHAGRGEGVDEGALRGVPARPDVQQRLGTAHVEPPRGAGVALLGLQHVLQEICKKTKPSQREILQETST